MTISYVSTTNSPSVQLLQALGGGLAGAGTRFMTQPLDVLKIRFQLQVEPLRSKSHGAKYNGIMQALRSIYREEGIRGVWKGHMAGQAMSITYSLVQFWSYEQLRLAAHENDFFRDRQHLTYFMCGGIAGCVGTIAAQPFDVIRTRVVAADPGTRSGRLRPVSGIYKIFRREGIRGVTGGLLLTIMQIYPLVGINFVLYKSFNHMAVSLGERMTGNPNPSHKIPGIVLFLSAGISGVLSKLIVYPLDVIKKRIMLDHFQEERKSFGINPTCSNLRECMASTMRNEGVAGFYKGVMPTLYKSGVMTAFYFTIYDFFNRNVTMPYHEREEQQIKEQKKLKLKKTDNW